MKFLPLRVILVFLALLPQATGAASNDLPIPITYFGLHIHRADQGTAWPNVPFGSWRLWDAYVTWADLEPEKNRWNFARLDRYVAMAELTKVDILLPLANTPRWAAARPNEPSAYKPGNASEPGNIEDWRVLVKTVGERYKGRIHNFEIWNEPNIKHHYSGSTEKLVELTCEASRVLKSIDSANKIVSPAATAGAIGHGAYLDNFLALGGSKCIDVVAHHFYVPNLGPEAMVPLIREVRKIMTKNGLANYQLWDTETGWWLANGDGTPDHPMVAKGGWKKIALDTESGDLLTNTFLLARSEGVDRFYWYSWDNRYGLGLIETTSGVQKPLVKAWQEIASELVGASGLKCAESENKWTCTYTRKDGIARKRRWVLN